MSEDKAVSRAAETMALAEERALAARMKKDPEAFGRIFDLHFDAVFNFILHRVADAALAEDLTAQTFYRALKNRWKFRWSGVPVSAWLHRIAINEVNGHFRRLGRRRTRDLAPLADRLADRGPGPDQELMAAEEEVARQEDFLLLHESIRALKEEEQSLIVMRYFENRPFSEIARILGRREGTLRMRTVRALEKLKTHLLKRGLSDERIRGIPFPREETRRQGGPVQKPSAARAP